MIKLSSTIISMTFGSLRIVRSTKGLCKEKISKNLSLVWKWVGSTWVGGSSSHSEFLLWKIIPKLL